MLWSMTASLEAPTEWHRHEVYEFIWCRAGCGRIEVRSTTIDLQAGRTLLVAPNVDHRFLVADGQPAELKLLCLNPQDLATFLSPAQAATLDGVRTAAVTCADHGDQRTLRELTAMIPDGFAIDDARELRVVWAAIGLILALHGEAQDLPPNPACQRYRQKIDELRAWIDSRLNETIGLDDVASRFGLSRSVLTREFRRHTGKSWVDYCNGRRIEKAAQILASGGSSITDAALASGFANLSYFHRQFKAIYGLPPAAFRRQLLGAANERRGGGPKATR